MSYYIQKEVSVPFERAIERLKEELQKEGFGVLTDIDIQDTFKKKLDVEFRRYRILGACNPRFAHEGLQQEARLGLLLPCNVIVQEAGNGKVEVAAVDPVASMERTGNKRLTGLASQVQAKLQQVIASL